MIAENITGWMGEKELEWIAETARGKRLIVEIGVWQGRSTWQWCKYSSGLVIGIDSWSLPTRGGTQYDDFGAARIKAVDNLREFIESGRLLLIHLTSDEAARWLEYVLWCVVPDVLFIDGDHNIECVKREIEWGRKLGVPIIAGHDYPEVKKAIEYDHDLCIDTIWKLT